MPELPTGTVTFLFTDIEGSTQLWERHPEAMQPALARHDALLRAAIESHDGHVVKSTGDGVLAVFATALDGLAACLAAQRGLHAENWGEVGSVRVRMGLHTGAAELREGDYYGPPLNRAARLMAAGHGGQVLLSLATAELVRDHLLPGCELRDLGERRLKDLIRPEHVFQLVAPDLPATFPPLKTLDARPNNLPAQATPFIGREREVEAVRKQVLRPDVRLLTLTGPGGTGKTRLSLQAAADLVDDFDHGVFFVPLADISDPGVVASAIAQALGVRETGGRPLLNSLKDFLRDKALLLVLDNFEQVVAAVPLVGELLAACPRLKVLVTSRTVLRVYGEREYPVPPLELPDPRRLPPLQRLTQYESVRLFIERAQAVKADFAVTNESAPAVAEICHRLDGLPLAIELAAARIKILTPQALLERLDSRLRVLTGGARDLPARQQTLRGAIAWSYDLLDEEERRLFSRLAVFRGGCTFESAEAVCNADGDLAVDLLDGLTSLVDKSLLRQDEAAGGEPRFVMLETIREYGLERLAEQGEEETIRRHHAEHFLALAETAAPQLHGPQSGRSLEQLEREHDNLRAALRWSLDRGEAEPGLRFGGALFWFWYLNGHITEGRSWLSQVLALPAASPQTVSRAKALGGIGLMAWVQGDFAFARTATEEALAIARALGDKRLIAAAAQALGSVIASQGDYSAARALLQEGLTLAREVGDRWVASLALRWLGYAALVQGDPAAARALLEESLSLARQIGDRINTAGTLSALGMALHRQGDLGAARAALEEALAVLRQVGDRRGIANTLGRLAATVRDQGDYAAARELCAESLGILRELGDRSGIVNVLELLASLAAGQGQPERALRLAGAAASLRESVGGTFAPIPNVELERWLPPARQALAHGAAAAAWSTGREMSLDQAINYALGERGQPPDHGTGNGALPVPAG